VVRNAAKSKEGESKRRGGGTKSNVTHNNIITANNVIINYNGGSGVPATATGGTAAGAENIATPTSPDLTMQN